MGLEEQAAVESFRNGYYRGLVARVENAAGTDVMMEIDWETLAEENIDHNEAFSKVYFEPLIKAFQSISSIEAGALFLQRQLKKVIIKNSGQPPSYFYKEGILTIDQKPSVQTEDIEQRAQVLEKILKGCL